MKLMSLVSTRTNVDGILADFERQLDRFEMKALIVFSSTMVEPVSLNKALKDRFPSVELFGCTTAGELTSGRMLRNAVVGMAFGPDILEDLHVELIGEAALASGPDVVFKAFEEHFGSPVSALDHEKYLGIILIDGMSGAEESIMDVIGNKTDITVIGGSAGDDRRFEKTWVFANGEAVDNGAVFAILKLRDGFDIIKTQSFCALDKVLHVTKVKEGTREVVEFNGKPAAAAYAEALGVPLEKLPDRFMSHPVGLVLEGGEIYVRSPQQLHAGNVLFYCAIPEGMDVSILESTNILADTAAAIAAKKAEMGGISGILSFNCILRTLELEQRGETGAYGALFSDIPTAGFSTYGEELIGHINQTATMVAFR